MPIKNLFNKLFRRLIIEEVPEKVIFTDPEPADWIFGAETGLGVREAIAEKGQYLDEWLKLEYGEFQRKKLETFTCTNHTTLNCNELLIWVKYKLLENLSERFNAKMSGTGRAGN